MGVTNSAAVVAFVLLTALTLPGLSWVDDSALSLGNDSALSWEDDSALSWLDDSASSSEELTLCQKMMAKCRDNWGECFDRHAFNGDACCQQGASFKCGDDMTGQEAVSKDPVFAKLVKCMMAGHPDLESLQKCLPQPSDCKDLLLCGLDFDPTRVGTENCPKKVKCWQRKHSSVDDFFKCWPKGGDIDAECNAPLPPIENITEA